MTTNDVRDFIRNLGVADRENCYSFKLDNKKLKSIGIYPLKRNGAARIPIGGLDNTSYGVFPASFLVHWTKSSVESEKAARTLFDILVTAKDEQVNDVNIKFVQMLMPEPQYVNTDDSDVHEWVIEALIFYER